MAPQESSRETGGPWRARSALDVPSVLSFFCLFPWAPPFSWEEFTEIFWSCYIQKKKPGPSITFLLQIERVPRERQGYAAARERGILPHQPGPPHSHPRGAQFSACPWQSAGRSRGGKWGHGLTCRDPASPLNHPLALLPPQILHVCVCVCLPAYVSGTRLHFLVKILSKIPAKSLRSSGKYALLGGSGRVWGLRPLLSTVIHGSGSQREHAVPW